MAPPKFDDFSKTAKDVLTDDYKAKPAGKPCQGFKAKMKTNFEGLNDIIRIADEGGKREGATVTTDIDFSFGSDQCATPAKITWKVPKPFGIAGLAFDKFEISKDGKIKLEASSAVNSDTKVEVKSEQLSLSTISKVKVGVTHTGIKNALAKVETDAALKYVAECSYAVGGGTAVGLRSTPDSQLDVALQYVNGPAFFSAIATKSFSSYDLHGYYKAAADLKLAVNCNCNEKKQLAFEGGLAYNIAKGTLVKGKVAQKDGSLALSTAVKLDLAQGVTMTPSSSVPLMGGGAWNWGLHFNVE